MRKCIALFLLLLPGIALAQATKEDYAIYSQYLKHYRAESAYKVNFIVRESTDYIRKYDSTGIKDIVTQLRNFLNGDPVSVSNVRFMYKAFADTLKKDTIWMPLITTLNQKMKSEFILKNKFSKSLHAGFISNNNYSTYFGNSKELEKGWAKFHQHYTKSAVLVEFSAIAGDNKRAVFYFIEQSGSIGAKGYIVFCYKENNKWKFIPTLPLWQS